MYASSDVSGWNDFKVWQAKFKIRESGVSGYLSMNQNYNLLYYYYNENIEF